MEKNHTFCEFIKTMQHINNNRKNNGAHLFNVPHNQPTQLPEKAIHHFVIIRYLFLVVRCYVNHFKKPDLS